MIFAPRLGRDCFPVAHHFATGSGLGGDEDVVPIATLRELAAIAEEVPASFLGASGWSSLPDGMRRAL